MAVDGSLIFDTKIDQSGFKQGAAQLKNAGNSIVKSLGLAFSTGAIAKGMVSLGQKSVALASDLQEVQNVVDVAFGDGAEKVNAWAKAADKAYGLSELSAKQYVGTMGAMLKSMGLAEDEMQQMSMTVTGLAGDFASFYNITSEEAFAKIRAGLSGETEPLKQLGINLSVANLEAFALAEGMEKAYSEMTQAEQVTLRYNYLMAQSADAQGDFTRTSDSLANQQRITSLAIETVGKELGQELIPLVTKATTAVGKLASGLADALSDRGIRGGVDYITESFPLATAAVSGLAAAYGTMAVVGTTAKLMKEFTAAQTAANAKIAAGTALALGEAGALTTKEIVVAALTGKLKLATAAQLLFNTAVKANPIGVAAVAIGALVGGVTLLDKTLRKTHPEMYELSNAIEDCSAKNEDLRKSLEESAEAYNETMESAEAQGVALDNLSDKLFSLSGSYSGSIAEQRRMEAICDELNGSIEGLNISFDAQTGAINMTEDALRGLIAQQKETAKWNAVQERYTEVLKQQADAEYNLYLAQQAYNEAKEKATADLGNGFGSFTKADADLQRAATNLAEAQAGMDDASEAAVELEGYINELGATTTETAAAIDVNTEAIEEERSAMVELGHGVQFAQGTLDDLGITAEDAAERLDSLTDAATNMFDQINTKSELSYEEMLENLEANTAAVEAWGNNMAYLAGKIPQELYDALAEAGPEEMAGAVNELASQTDFSELNALWEAGGAAAVQAFLQQMGVAAQETEGAGVAITQAVAEELANDETMSIAGQEAIVSTQEAMKLAVGTAGFDLIGGEIAGKIAEGLSGLNNEMYNHGVNAMQGFINGMESKRQAIKNKVADLAKAASKTFTVKLQIQSPSKLFERYGEDTVAGFVGGVEQSLSSVRAAMNDFGSVAAGVATTARGANVQQISSYPAAAPVQTTTNVTQNIYGMDRSPAQVLREAIFLQERAVLTGV